MKGFLSRVCVGLFAAAVLVESGFAQQPLTWQEVRERFETSRRLKRSRRSFVQIQISLCRRMGPNSFGTTESGSRSPAPSF
jgi:hypothetical protein